VRQRPKVLPACTARRGPGGVGLPRTDGPRDRGRPARRHAAAGGVEPVRPPAATPLPALGPWCGDGPPAPTASTPGPAVRSPPGGCRARHGDGRRAFANVATSAGPRRSPTLPTL